MNRAAFQNELLQRAAQKRTLARTAPKQTKVIQKPREKITMQRLLSEIRDALQMMTAFLERHDGSAIPGEFEVIERDAEGRVKRFRCLEK